MVPFVVTKPGAASVLAEPAVMPSVLAEVGDLTPSVLAPWGLGDRVVPAGAGAAAVRPVWFASRAFQQLVERRFNLGGAHCDVHHFSACLKTSLLSQRQGYTSSMMPAS